MTAKGEQRRAALVDAAAQLLLEQGYSAVSHRAVAARAGLPLAATTYYFATLDALLVQAADQVAAAHLADVHARVAGLRDRPVGAPAAARTLVRLVLPADRGRGTLSAFYERYLEAGRSPALQQVVAAWNGQIRSQLRVALARLGHDADPTLVLAVVDGLTLTALAEGAADPERVAVRGLTRLLNRP